MARVNTGKVMHLHVLTEPERDALTATKGMIIYNSSTNKLNFYNGTNWRAVDDSAV
jgi:hypothetical protein